MPELDRLYDENPPAGPTIDPLTVQCPACLAGPGEQCYATSSDLPRRHPHRLRGLAAAKRLVRCEHCEGIGWLPETTDINEEG